MPDLIYGFHQLADIRGNRIVDGNVETVAAAVTMAMEEHNRQLDALTSLFVERTTLFKTTYRGPASSRSQPLDQNGRARPIKGGVKHDVAFPIQGSGAAWGTNFLTKTLMTVDEANNATKTLMDGDTRWMGDHILAALFAATSWTYNDETENSQNAGTLTIMPLANGDSRQYAFSGTSGTGTDNHLLAQAAAISDAANPFRTIYTEITEHPDNQGEVVVMVASDLVSDIEGLATFNEKSDPNIRTGSGNNELVGSAPTNVPGRLIGYVQGCWIYEWTSMPSGYMVAVSTGANKALRMREYPVAQLQGFNLVGERNDHPFYESQYARWAGFGAWNGAGALAYRVGNASYATPTNFASPMP